VGKKVNRHYIDMNGKKKERHDESECLKSVGPVNVTNASPIILSFILWYVSFARHKSNH